MMLRVDGIHTYYGLVHMLQGVSLEIEDGEVLAVLGRNGAGKTTMIKTIMGLVPPRAGKVIYRNEDVTGLPPHLVARRGIAYVPAGRGVFGTLTALENLEIVRGSRAGMVDEVFRRFPKLAEVKGRFGRFLSGGEQQMLAIGRAIMTSPSLMLLDEPSQGLAPLVLDAIVEMLRDLKREGTAMLLVEQNVDTAVALADRVMILDEGAKVFEGTPAQLTSDEQITIRYLGVGV